MERPNINVTSLPPRKVLKKSPNVKRKSKVIPVSDKVQLEKVLGLTVTSNAALSVHHNAGIVAYPAGCVVVVYNQRKNKQSHIFNQSRKTITCLAISPDAKYLVTGECGHQPMVRVWDLEEKTQVLEFSGHKFAISCVIFSPNMKYIVSVGNQHDMAVNVWNWKTKTKLAAGKVATKVSGIQFTDDSNSFVTVGNRHVKFWYLDTSKTKVRETIPLNGRSGILGEQKNNHFCGVVVGRGASAGVTFALTKSGLLCEFNDKRLLDKWVELRADGAHCMTADNDYIYVGCSDGIIRVFSASSLHFISTMPKPHYLGVDVAAGQDSSHLMAHPTNAQYPDCIAIGIDTENHKITAVYNDHSVYIWDVRDIRKVGKSRSFLYHSSCIWGLEVYPDLDDSYKSSLPRDSFITCSSDDTIRIWNLDSHMSSDVMKRNIYSNELLKVLYTDKELTNILDIEFNPAGKTDKTDTQCLEKNGVRCLRVSPDGQLLASGDRQGNIRIHELQFMEEIKMLEAHDAEVLCLEYTRPQTGVRLLTSASRDRLIHVFDMDQNYGLVQTLDDHSAAITSVRYAEQDQQLHLLSCGADKSLLFRTAQVEPEFQFVLNRHLVGKTTLYDMDLDPTHKFVATACQDRNFRIYNIKNGKQKKSYKGAIGDDGTMIKIQLDPSGQYVATSCSDKNLCIVDFFTGELQASMFGHSEVVTGLKFMNDFKHLISVSGDGCIFVWRLSPDLTHNIHQRLVTLGKMSQEQLVNAENRGAFIPATPKVIFSDPADKQNCNYDDDLSFPVIENQAARRKLIDDEETIKNNNASETPAKKENQTADPYQFDVGGLPAWAKKQVMNEPPKAEDTNLNPTGPRGRWAQRIDNQSVVIKSVLDENNLQLSIADSLDRRRFTVEEQTLADQISDLRRETIIIRNGDKKSPNIPIIADDETNQDDEDEDDEFGNKSLAEKHSILEDDDDTDSPVRLSGGKVTLTRGSDKFSPMRQLRQSLSVESDNEGEDEEQKEDILYLPTEEGPESPDAMASSFHVFEGDTNSYKDESTDHGSNESDTESEPSAPNTPHVPLSETDSDAGFMKINFENLGHSPLLTESFDSTIESIEKRFAFNEDPSQMNIFNSRHSISSRFLSRSQQQHLRNLAIQNNMQKQPSNVPNQTHAALRSVGGGQVVGSIIEEHPSDVIPEKGPPASPPMRRRRMPETPSIPPSTRLSTPAASQEQPFSEVGKGTSRGRMSLGGVESQSRCRPSLGERSRPRKIADEKSSGEFESGIGNKKWKSLWDVGGTVSRSATQSPAAGRPARRSKTPTPRSKTPTPLSPGAADSDRSVSPFKNVTRSNARGRVSSDFPPPNRSKSEYNLNSGSDDSAPASPSKRNKPILARTNSYQKETRSSKAKILDSGSTLPRNTKRNLKGKINPSLKNKFKSTPDLANLDDDDDDDFGNVQKLPAKTTEDLPATKGESKNAKGYNRRSMPATKLDRQDPFGLNQPASNSTDSIVGVSAKTARSSASSVSSDTSDPDRLVMPPPPTTKVPALKSDTFHKKTSSKPSSQNNLTLAEAKAILLGKSTSSAINSGSGSKADSGSSTPGKVEAPQQPERASVPKEVPLGKWSNKSNTEELDDMPVKERPRRVPFRQPISQGEGDDPREGSPEAEPKRRPVFPSVSSPMKNNVVSSPVKQAEKPKVTSPNSDGEADSPGSSYAGSDTEPSVEIPPRTVKSPPPRSRTLPSTTQRQQAKFGEADVNSVQRSPGRPSSPVKTFSLPRENRSGSETDVRNMSSPDSKLSHGSLDRKGITPDPFDSQNVGSDGSPRSLEKAKRTSNPADNQTSVNSPRKNSRTGNPLDILGNFVRKSSSSGDVPREPLPPRKESPEKISAISDEEKPKQTVKSRISTWETASKSPPASPSPVRRRSASPMKGVSKSKSPEAVPPPRPNNTPLPPPPNVTSPRNTAEIPPKDVQEKQNPLSSFSRSVSKHKDNDEFAITSNSATVAKNDFEPDTTSGRGVARALNMTNQKEHSKKPETITNIASPAVPIMNATFTVSPMGTPVSTPLSGIASLRAAARTAAELKQKQQEQARLEATDQEQSTRVDPEVEGEGDAEEIKRPDKSKRYPPTSLTASPPHQIKTVQLSEPKSPESLSTSPPPVEAEATNPASKSSPSLSLSDQTVVQSGSEQSTDTADEKQCEELLKNLQSTVDQVVAFSKKADADLQEKITKAVTEMQESLGKSLQLTSGAASAAAQLPSTPDNETMELLRMIRASSDKLLDKFGPI